MSEEENNEKIKNEIEIGFLLIKENEYDDLNTLGVLEVEKFAILKDSILAALDNNYPLMTNSRINDLADKIALNALRSKEAREIAPFK